MDECYEDCAKLADAMDALEQAGVDVLELKQQYIDILMALSLMTPLTP